MKKILALLLLAMSFTAKADVLLTGIIDGSSSNPKGIELYVSGTMDLTGYAIEIEANGGSDWYNGYTFSGSYSDQYIYITSTIDTMTSLFDTATSANTISNSSFNQNGNDAIRLLDASGNVIDQYGDPADVTTGFAWNYLDSFAYRLSNTTASGTFVASDWYIAGADLLDSGNDPALEYFGGYAQIDPPSISVPDVSAMNMTSAQSAIEAQGLIAAFQEQYSETVAAGSVISQDPAASTLVYASSTVTVVISKGPAPDTQTVTLGWEGNEAALGSYGTLEELTNTSEAANSGSSSLKMTEPSDSPDTPQAFLAMIGGLNDGDTVTASFFVYDDTEAVSPSVRIWGHYLSDNTDLNSYAASASGNSTYSAGTGWEELTYTWTYNSNSGANGNLIVEARLYGSSTDGIADTIYIDDLTVVCPTYATVTLPLDSSLVTVPDVTDMSKTAATSAIAAAGLTAEIVDTYSDTVAVGGFISQNPAAGAPVAAESTVTVYYSLGAAPEFNSMGYGWEDGGTVLGTYNAPNVANVTDPNVTENDLCLQVERTGSVPQAYVAWINNLQDGDLVTASFWVYDDTPGATPSGRIWAHYSSDSSDVNSYSGSLEDNNDEYSAGTGWSYLEQTWVFVDDGANTGIVVEARAYSSAGAIIYVDNVKVTAPGYATITFPGTGYATEPHVQADPFQYWSNPTDSYSWEDGGIDVGVSPDYEAVNPKVDSTEANTGSSSLKIVYDEASSAPQVYLARITGLKDGDVVKGRMSAKKGSGTGIRIWGIYETNGSYSGSADGYSAYCGDDWTLLGNEWTFDDGDKNDRNALVIEARIYGNEDDYGFVDDLELWLPEGASVEWPSAPTEPVCYLDNNLTEGDCVIDMNDFAVLGSQWMTDGFGTPDPNDGTNDFYKFYKISWDKAGDGIISTYPDSGDAASIPVVNNIVDPTDASNRVLELIAGTYYNAQVNLVEISGLVDGDKVYTAIRWKDDFAGTTPSLQIAMSYLRASSYAGGPYSLPVNASSNNKFTSDSEWGYAADLFVFEDGVSEDYPTARDGVNVTAVLVDGKTPEAVCGYIDEIIISVPVHYDAWGWPTAPLVISEGTVTEIDSLDAYPEVCLDQPFTDINSSTGSYCVVNVADLSELMEEWLMCDWNDGSMCEN